jgi:hypothetical protein
MDDGGSVAVSQHGVGGLRLRLPDRLAGGRGRTQLQALAVVRWRPLGAVLLGCERVRCGLGVDWCYFSFVRFSDFVLLKS